MHVVILMSDTGGGHRSLSRAIAAGLERRLGAGVRSTIVDPFDAAPARLPSAILGLYGPIIQRIPAIYGWIYDALDAPGRFAAIGRRLGQPVVAQLRQLLTRERPDAIVCAHALTTTLALDALDDVGGEPVPLAAMVTELATVHWSWIDHRVSRYFAATDEVVGALRAHGVPPSRVQLTGLPVGHQFGAIAESPEETRRRLRLIANRTTALVLAGGEGSGRLAELVPRLAAALPDLQLVVVCGRNERLRRGLSGYGLPPTVRVLGFVENMPELMHAADFVLTKGGPQTIAETLAAGRPVVVTELLPGQERGNGAYVVRRGAGYLALTLPDVLAASRRLASDEAERRRLAAAARQLGPRGAATNVADALRVLTAEPAPV